MRTPQDIINRKEANQRYYKLEENKQQKRDYMKAYRERPYVKAKLHEYYVVNKMHWGEITKAKRKKNNWGGKREKKKIYEYHEEWHEKTAIETMTSFMQKTQKDLQMKHKDKDLERIYNDIFGDAVKYMDDYEVQAVAATYMAIAMRLYKTHLEDDEYKSMIQTVVDTEVKPYKEPKLH